MNKETYMFFGQEVSFDEEKLRKLLASQLNNEQYVEAKSQLIEVIYDRTKEYKLREAALNLVFKHLKNQNVVVYGRGGITTAQMLKIMREVLN